MEEIKKQAVEIVKLYENEDKEKAILEFEKLWDDSTHLLETSDEALNLLLELEFLVYEHPETTVSSVKALLYPNKKPGS